MGEELLWATKNGDMEQLTNLIDEKVRFAIKRSLSFQHSCIL